MSVKRVGGAFGGKAKRPKFAAIACALGAHVTKRSDTLHNVIMITSDSEHRTFFRQFV